MYRISVKDRADIGVLNADVEALLQRQVVELIVDVVSVLNVLLQADDGEALECFWLVNHRVQTVGVVQGPLICRVWISSWRRLRLVVVVVLIAASCLLSEVWRFENLWLLKDLGLDGVWVELDVEAPLLDLFTLCNHLVQLLDGVDSIVGLLEETLAHLSHSLLVFTDLLRNADEHGELRRQVDVLALLLNFKQRLLHLTDDLIVLLLEVGSHGDGGADLTLLEIASLWAHIEAHIADLVGLVVAVTRHNDGTLKFVLNGLLDLSEARWLIRVANSLLTEALNLLIDQLQAVVNRQILADVVNDEVEATLEDPG